MLPGEPLRLGRPVTHGWVERLLRGDNVHAKRPSLPSPDVTGLMRELPSSEARTSTSVAASENSPTSGRESVQEGGGKQGAEGAEPERLCCERA